MSCINILRAPDRVMIYSETDSFALEKSSNGRWQKDDVELTAQPRENDLPVVLRAPRTAVKRIHLRWQEELPTGLRFLGDHWERGYGDLEWRGMIPHRPMPWYFLAYDGKRTSGCGVKTGAHSLCFWQADPGGISLWLDVRCGGRGVRLGNRALHAATIIAREGADGETPFQAARALCRLMCDQPLMPPRPVYGGNNWYYAYGNTSHEQILDDARLIAELSPVGDNPPFMTVDGGWQASSNPAGGGPWIGNRSFPDMPGLAQGIEDAGARPAIWIRPLLVEEKMPESWLLPADRFDTGDGRVLDPTVPGALEQIASYIRMMTGWGYELIKYDFSTFDIAGKWGHEMGGEFTPDGWSFADRSKTTAEIILDLYRTIHKAAGDALLIGCNTVGHLAAGLVHLQRTGDDTSGLEWERTRKMGINTLAFRAAQHGAFFAADADCVGLTNKIPWELNRQWLDLLARSGAPLFVSIDPEAAGPEQRRALKEALALAAEQQSLGEPLDWLDTTCPARWLLNGTEVEFDWTGVFLT